MGRYEPLAPLDGRTGLVDHLVDCLGVFDRSKEWPRSKPSAKSPSAEGDALRRWFGRLSPEKRVEVGFEIICACWLMSYTPS